MIPDRKGVDRGVPGLNLLPEEAVEAVLVDAAPGGGAVEAAQAAAVDADLPQVVYAHLAVRAGEEGVDHGPEPSVVPAQVRDQGDGLAALGTVRRDGGRDALPGGLCPGHIRRGLGQIFLHAPEDVAQEGPGLPAALLAEQVLHIRGEAPDIAQAQVRAVVPDKAVGRDIVKVLGGGELGGPLPAQVHPLLLDQLDEAVELGRDQEGVDRVAEQEQIRLLQRRGAGAEVLLDGLNPLPHVQIFKFYLPAKLFQVMYRLKGNAVFPLGGAVEYQYVHLCLLFER